MQEVIKTIELSMAEESAAKASRKRQKRMRADVAVTCEIFNRITLMHGTLNTEEKIRTKKV